MMDRKYRKLTYEYLQKLGIGVLLIGLTGLAASYILQYEIFIPIVIVSAGSLIFMVFSLPAALFPTTTILSPMPALNESKTTVGEVIFSVPKAARNYVPYPRLAIVLVGLMFIALGVFAGLILPQFLNGRMNHLCPELIGALTALTGAFILSQIKGNIKQEKLYDMTRGREIIIDQEGIKFSVGLLGRRSEYDGKRLVMAAW